MSYFLVVYDRTRGQLVEGIREFPDEAQRDARQARLEREIRERDRPNVEVVLLGADSEKALRVTHARYFSDFYEEDEPIENILAILSREPDGITAPPDKTGR